MVVIKPIVYVASLRAGPVGHISHNQYTTFDCDLCAFVVFGMWR